MSTKIRRTRTWGLGVAAATTTFLASTSASFAADPTDGPGQGMGNGKTITDSKNPLTGITPDITVFGNDVPEKGALLLAGVWAVAIFACVLFVIWSWVSMAKAKGRGMEDETMQGTRRLKQSIAAFCGVIGTPLVIGAAAWLMTPS